MLNAYKNGMARLKNEKYIELIKNHPLVESISIETSTGDGYWAYPIRGYYVPSMGCHTAHEYSLAKLWSVVQSIKPCDCEDCK